MAPSMSPEQATDDGSAGAPTTFPGLDPSERSSLSLRSPAPPSRSSRDARGTSPRLPVPSCATAPACASSSTRVRCRDQRFPWSSLGARTPAERLHVSVRLSRSAPAGRGCRRGGRGQRGGRLHRSRRLESRAACRHGAGSGGGDRAARPPRVRPGYGLGGGSAEQQADEARRGSSRVHRRRQSRV